MNWYLGVLKKYAVFKGRAQRKEFWFFVLFHILAIVVLVFLEDFLNIAPDTEGLVLAEIYNFAVIIPIIAVTIRRLHDTGRRGWWILINFVPAVGGLILLALLAQDGEAGENDYGANPKQDDLVIFARN